ncbi:uncharacterized protein LOC101850750 [Aplysia californica]|uniref:Uncharacterized protein LOC101850750 n=1 Tax=Aplysia californica TaxID=6500 RepID=A0ABM1A8Z8_APLCA|nr:uncharacterized protein LOC101850750 [Aplysia californica]
MVQNSSVYPVHENMTSLDLAFVMISNVTSFLSVSGSLAIISCYVTMKEIRTTSRLLLVFLSVANIIQGLATLLQTGTYYRSVQFPPESSFLCQSAAGLMVLGHVCCALWTVAVTFYLFLCVAGHCITVANRILFLLHAFCWIMPRRSLSSLLAMGDNLQGLVNAVFFCLATRQIRRLMYNKLTRCCTWARANRIIGHDHWVRVPSIVRAVTHRRPRKHKDMDGSDLDISGISLDLPSPDGDLGTGEDDVIFER